MKKLASTILYPILLVQSLSSLWVAAALELGQCVAPLGMESGEIKDEDISASSAYDMASVGPQNARIRKELNGGAWCPKRQIMKDVKEFLEINLHTLRVITMVETQGRFGNGQGQEFAEHYMLEYWRPGLTTWNRFKNRKAEEVISANSNTYTGVEKEVNPAIIATKVRFVPYSNHPRTVCMRVELYGCPWRDGIVSYSMPQGERRGSEIDLYDMTYDGVEEENYLYGGLGQLTDGQRGQDNFRLDSNGFGKGYEWVGWKNDTGHSRPIEIIYEFDQVRNFTAAYFYCNNLFSKDVQVFSTARLTFSIGGRFYNSEPIVYSYMPDTIMENARNVTIRLQHRVGRFVKVQLTFAAKWMMISEVSFDSVPAIGNFTEETEPIPYVPTTRDDAFNGARDDLGTGVSTAVSDEAMSNQYIGLVIGVLAAVILLLVVVIFIIILRNKRRKQNNNHTVLKPMEKRVTINMKMSGSDDFPDARMFYLNQKDLQMNLVPCNNSSCQANGNIYGQVALEDPDKTYYHEPYKTYQEPYNSSSIGYSMTRKLPELPQSPDYTGSSTSREYAVPDITKTGPPVPLIPGPPPPQVPKTPIFFPPPPDRHYAATEIFKSPTPSSIQGVSGTTLYAVPNLDILNGGENPVPEFPRHRLQFLEKLGEGQFGEVHLCEAEGIPELIDVPTFGTSKLVAVKTLRKNATETARSDFHKEVRILSRLRDANIVRVLGICTRDEPLCMIVEYMENGDLNQFLQEHVAETVTTVPPNADILSYGCLIYMATQIASGMKYLESLNFVHRDLATRNCLVGRAYTIKIADFGMSRNLYNVDYYKIEGRAVLPIRWMAWESILLGKFTPKSDVWSFAVTLWEILTFAREQPYEDLSDEKVIENVGHFYHNDSLQVYLPQPINCPKEIYDLMRECWQRNEAERPNFREIHLFLQRKNLGYEPEV
uniref:Protein kinase domain-containing protein n=1 Tax=Strigamia maritima TaxID=126957 RepID=T1J7A6_STRMM